MHNSNCPKLFILVPCFNEEDVLPQTVNILSNKLLILIKSKTISKYSKIVFIDDGSSDGTWNLIESKAISSNNIVGIKLSRNYGHQNALIAGLNSVVDDCDAAITIDADLQDDVDAIDSFIDKYSNGCQIVYGVRKDRSSDKLFKRFTAQTYYKLLLSMDINIIYNHADYRLMSKKAIKHLLEYKETNLFLRGIVPSIGLTSDSVEYERHERIAGKSKYPLSKMISLAIEGITSFSIRPIFFISYIGIFMFFISILFAIYYVVGYLKGNTISGWATIVVSLWGIGGILLLSIGVIGIYIGKIYLETKQRPRFIIEKEVRK